MKNLVNEFDVIFLMETVAYFNLFKDFNLFEDLDKQSTIGKLTDEMKVSLDKNDELIQKSGNYLNKLPFSEVLKSKIYSTCSFNYLALTIESKTIKEIANKLKEPKWKKTLFERSQEEWSLIKDAYKAAAQKVSDFLLNLQIQAWGLLQKAKPIVSKIAAVLMKVVNFIKKFSLI